MSDVRNQIVDYISERFAQEDFLLNNILERQESDGGPMMNVGPDQGKLLYLIIKSHKAKSVLEIGSYYGYSSVWMGRAIHELNLANQSSKTQQNTDKNEVSQKASTHHLHCVEVSAKQVDIINEHLEQAGLTSDVTVHEGAGVDIMKKFIQEGRRFDIVFVDADKGNYSNYLDLASELLPSGGLLLVDNCIWDGAVLDPNTKESSTKAIQAFNNKLSASDKFESVIVTIQDGLAYAVRK